MNSSCVNEKVKGSIIWDIYTPRMLNVNDPKKKKKANIHT